MIACSKHGGLLVRTSLADLQCVLSYSKQAMDDMRTMAIDLGRWLRDRNAH
jgi:hypothetical protein